LRGSAGIHDRSSLSSSAVTYAPAFYKAITAACTSASSISPHSSRPTPGSPLCQSDWPLHPSPSTQVENGPSLPLSLRHLLAALLFYAVVVYVLPLILRTVLAIFGQWPLERWVQPAASTLLLPASANSYPARGGTAPAIRFWPDVCSPLLRADCRLRRGTATDAEGAKVSQLHFREVLAACVSDVVAVCMLSNRVLNRSTASLFHCPRDR
jgi:hypothetical protein